MSRHVVRNSFARENILSERVYFAEGQGSCAWCGQKRNTRRDWSGRQYLLRFLCSPDSINGRQYGIPNEQKLFCSRSCCEAYIGHSLDEGRR
jgi:hypothetical protein